MTARRVSCNRPKGYSNGSWSFHFCFYLIGSLVVAFASIEVTQADDIKYVKNETEIAAVKAVYESVNRFSSLFFKHVVDENPGNLVSSPLSAAVVLAMAGYGARGETEKQFRNVLRLPTPDSLTHCVYQKLIDDLNETEELKLFLANKMFVTEKYPMKPNYTQLTETYFLSATQLVDFKKNEEVANTINAWVEQNTNNVTKDVISEGDLSEEMSMILVNAIYFKGLLEHKFFTSFTKRMPFELTKNTTKNVTMMFRRDFYMYALLPDLNAKFVEIQFKRTDLAMMIILPKEVDGLPQLVEKLKNTTLTSILQSGTLELVNVLVPRFKAETEIELNSVLKKMGLTDAFDDRADFSGISDGPLKISKVVQKVFIDVDEEGPEIPGASRAKLEERAGVIYIDPCIVFKADRSSYYALCHKDNHLLFNGLVTEF